MAKIKNKSQKKSRLNKSLVKINTGKGYRWKGWRTSEKPGPITTYNIKDLEEVK